MHSQAKNDWRRRNLHGFRAMSLEKFADGMPAALRGTRASSPNRLIGDAFLLSCTKVWGLSMLKYAGILAQNEAGCGAEDLALKAA